MQGRWIKQPGAVSGSGATSHLYMPYSHSGCFMAVNLHVHLPELL